MRIVNSRKPVVSAAFILQPRTFAMAHEPGKAAVCRVVLVAGRNDGTPLITLDDSPLPKCELHAILETDRVAALRARVSYLIERMAAGGSADDVQTFVDNLIDGGWEVRAPRIAYYAPGTNPSRTPAASGTDFSAFSLFDTTA